MRKLILNLIAVFTIFWSSSAIAQDSVNALNLLRSSIPAGELPKCSLSRVCPIVSTNCPSAYPMCRTVRYYLRRSLRSGCKCTNSTGVGPSIPFVEPCGTGVTCAITPVSTLLVPIPTPTIVPTMAPTPTPTPTVSVNSYLEAQNNRTGMTVRNGGVLHAMTNDSIQYRWGANGAVNGISTYTILSGPNECRWATVGTWVQPMGDAGGQLASVQPCQRGTTYDISYRPVNAFGIVIGEQHIYVVVTN